MTSTTPSPRHQANIDRKAGRAVEAIELLITDQFIDATGIYTDVTDIASGFAFVLDQLVASDDDSAPWWTMIAIAHDLYFGRVGNKATTFDSSRQLIIDMLGAFVSAPAVDADVVDIFSGLTYSTEDAF